MHCIKCLHNRVPLRDIPQILFGETCPKCSMQHKDFNLGWQESDNYFDPGALDALRARPVLRGLVVDSHYDWATSRTEFTIWNPLECRNVLIGFEPCYTQ